MIIKTTLNRLPKKYRHMFYRKEDGIYGNRFYSVCHYNRCDKTYTIDSRSSDGLTEDGEIYLKANTVVYYEA